MTTRLREGLLIVEGEVEPVSVTVVRDGNEANVCVAVDVARKTVYVVDPQDWRSIFIENTATLH